MSKMDVIKGVRAIGLYNKARTSVHGKDGTENASHITTVPQNDSIR